MDVKAILAGLQHVFPTTKARHNITMHEDGVLRLTVFNDADSTWTSFTLDDNDMIRPPEELVREIQDLMSEPDAKEST